MIDTGRRPVPALLDLDAALLRINEVVIRLRDNARCNLAESLDRITAHPSAAPYSLPSFDNSAVDGYAYRHEDGKGQTSFTLRLIGHSLAGSPYPHLVDEGCAVRIATGAVLPKGTDTIVMQEQSAEMNGKVMINEAPPKGAFVRAAGSDFMIGDVVIPAGRRLTPQDVALLGALGLTEVLVLRRIKIAILSTGAELRAGGSALESGQIIDTNGLMLKQLLDRFPATISLPPPLPDSYEKTLEALKQTAVTHDVIITSGGISVGSHDFVRDVVHKIGIIYFWRLAIRPGKPVLFGQIGHCYILCLPGNPVSTMVTFFLIVVPFLQTLCGQETVLPPSFSVPLGAAFRKDARLRHFPRARLEKINNQWKAFPYPDQSSHLIGSLVATDGLLDLPQGLTDFPVDTLVQFRPFSGLFF